MVGEELKLSIGKLYKVKFDDSKKFEAFINDKAYSFHCNDTVFLLIDIIIYDHTSQYIQVNVLFPNGERGQIFYIQPSELKLIQ